MNKVESFYGWFSTVYAEKMIMYHDVFMGKEGKLPAAKCIHML